MPLCEIQTNSDVIPFEFRPLSEPFHFNFGKEIVSLYTKVMITIEIESLLIVVLFYHVRILFEEIQQIFILTFRNKAPDFRFNVLHSMTFLRSKSLDLYL